MMLRVVAVSGLGAIALTAWYVSITNQCTRAPPRYWLSAFEVELKLKEAGLSLVSMRANEDRCLETLATDRFGNRFGLIVNPETGAVLSQQTLPAADPSVSERQPPRAAPRAID